MTEKKWEKIKFQVIEFFNHVWTTLCNSEFPLPIGVKVVSVAEISSKRVIDVSGFGEINGMEVLKRYSVELDMTKPQQWQTAIQAEAERAYQSLKEFAKDKTTMAFLGGRQTPDVMFYEPLPLVCMEETSIKIRIRHEYGGLSEKNL